MIAMKTGRLSVGDALWLQPDQHADERGMFMEWFRLDTIADHTNRVFDVQQANCSISAAGVVRGIHFADIPPSQAKYVACISGSVLDVVVDIRVGSPTFGRWDSVVLDDVSRRAVFVPEGLGHAFMALSEQSVVSYLCSAPYAPGREHGINPLDPAIAIQWPTKDRNGSAISPCLSPKDATAPSLAEAERQGLLPTIEQARSFYRRLADGARSREAG